MRISHFTGPVYLIKGFHFLLKRPLKHYILVPMLINLLLFSVFIFSGFKMINHLTNLFPHYLHWLSAIFDVLFFLVTSVVLAYFFSMLTNLIGSPFNSFLSLKVEELASNKKVFPDDTWQDSLKDLPRCVKREVDKILYYIPRALLLLILFFIPVVNVIAGILWFIFNSWMMGLEYLDYPMDNHKMTFNQTKEHLKEYGVLNFTFGFAVMVVAMIPILNLIVMPAAVIGATLLYRDHSPKF